MWGRQNHRCAENGAAQALARDQGLALRCGHILAQNSEEAKNSALKRGLPATVKREIR